MNGLSYSDVCLIPQKGVLTSRSLADVRCDFLGRKYRLPIIPANMACTINFKLAEFLACNNYFYIMHRFEPYDVVLDWIFKHQHIPLISISLGVTQLDREFVNAIVRDSLHVDFITLDIAHGYSAGMEDMIKYVKKYLPDVKVIAGNVFGDMDSIISLEKWGADAIKVGLAFGKACTTYNKTGFASPMFSSGLEASQWAKVPLIGDGGIRENGDIAKALAAGYTMVMAGSMFAACQDSPAEFDYSTGQKIYYGSASAEAKGNNTHVEGKTISIDCNWMSYAEKLDEIQMDLCSSVSYAGGITLSALNHVKHIITK